MTRIQLDVIKLGYQSNDLVSVFLQFQFASQISTLKQLFSSPCSVARFEMLSNTCSRCTLLKIARTC